MTVTDANQCQAQAVVKIGEPSAVLATTLVLNDVLCKDGTTGSAKVTASGGTAPYSYLWSNGQTGEVVTGLSSGTHTVVVTDAEECESVSASVIIGEPDEALTAMVQNITGVSCKDGSDGKIEVTVTGGTGPYSYDWNNGAPDVEDPTGLAAGIYNLTVTDAHGCTASLTGVVVQEPSQALTVWIDGKKDANCQGGATGEATAHAGGGTANYTFVWSNGQTQSGGTSFTATGLSAGGYMVTVTDAKGCTAMAGQ